MTDRLRHALVLLNTLAPEDQDLLAQEIEELVDLRPTPTLHDIAGLWRDMPDDDDDFEVLDRIRHSSPPSLFVQEQEEL